MAELKPPIGATIRVTKEWTDGTKQILEGEIFRYAPEDPDVVELGEHGIDTPLNSTVREAIGWATISFEVLSYPEFPDGTDLRIGSDVCSRRDDWAESHHPEYRWYRLGSVEVFCSEEVWARILKNDGEYTVLRGGERP